MLGVDHTTQDFSAAVTMELQVLVTVLTCVLVLADAQSNSSISSRIIGGSTVGAISTYPWMVSIHKLAPTPVLYCGGSLIHTNWILTSAYCTKGGTSFKIFYGTLLYSTGSFLTATSAIPHPGYTTAFSHNNIALIKVSAPLSNTFNTIRLLPRSMCCDPEIYKDVLTGWGKTSTGATTPAAALMELSMPDITNLNCMASAWTASYIVPGVMCTAANAAAMPFTYDEGSPLVRVPSATGGAFVQVGIVSLFKPSLPNIFTRVCQYHDWLQSVTGISFG